MPDYYDREMTLYDLVRDLYCAAAIACFLWAAHRIGRGLVLEGRVRAYQKLADAYTPEERELLIHRIKQNTLART